MTSSRMRIPFPPPQLEWMNAHRRTSGVKFTCGYCGRATGTDVGYGSTDPNILIAICPICLRPTYIEYGRTTPTAPFGNAVEHLPDSIAALYAEARHCTTVEAYTGAVLICRKLLMHIAVEQGAEANRPFAYYVDYLVQHGYVPPNGRAWVDPIRLKGNAATHEIEDIAKEDVQQILVFVEMLLRFIYELPARAAGMNP
jgi:hypothetical protein